MTTTEILAKATPRPWEPPTSGFATNDGAVSIMAKDEELDRKRVALFDRQSPAKRGKGWETPCAERDANVALTLLAVNSYERDQETIRALTEALDDITDAARRIGPDMLAPWIQKANAALAQAKQAQP